MAYFLGRDVLASITTEHDYCGVSVSMDMGEAYVNGVRITEVSSIADGSEVIGCASAHSLTTGDPVQFTMDGTDSTVGTTGITSGTIYYAIVTSTVELKIATTYALAVAGTAIDLTGSEANETALKIARAYHKRRGEPGRYKIISRRGSYHGMTGGVIWLGGGAPAFSREDFEPYFGHLES